MRTDDRTSLIKNDKSTCVAKYGVILMLCLASCGTESELRSKSKGIITAAWESQYSIIGAKVTSIEILGISVNGNIGTVKARITSTTIMGSLTTPVETHDFYFKKYDTGWVLESFR